MKDIWKLVISLAVTFAAAAVGSIATFSQIPTWYVSLNRTIITPPNWVFGPVWTLLYILMAVAVFLVWRKGLENKTVKEGLRVYGGQLILNAYWSILFFGQHLILDAFIAIVLLLVLIVITTVWFFKVSKPAGYLMLPYVVWVSFATILNYAVYLANR